MLKTKLLLFYIEFTLQEVVVIENSKSVTRWPRVTSLLKKTELWPLGPAVYSPQAGVSCADCMVLCFGVVWAFKKKLLCQATKCWLAQLWVMV